MEGLQTTLVKIVGLTEMHASTTPIVLLVLLENCFKMESEWQLVI
jgi:hypothetical protein